jgi:nucleotide-binding universal stress UspA family protein
MRILLAIDGSEQSNATVDEIAHRHFPPGNDVRVISVVAPYIPGTFAPWDGLDASMYDQMEKSAREMATAAVEKAAAKLRANKGTRQLNVTTDVTSGSPKGVILEEAESFGANLIVVGSHGHGMLDRFLLGSVSQAVALHAKCSVEIVRSPKSREVMRILVAIDGSEQSDAVVDDIARQYFPADSEVRVISVVEAPNLGDGVDMSLSAEIEKTARQRASSAVEKAAAQLRADEGNHKRNVTTDVLSGSPKRVILEEAESFGADLIVVGSHGHGMLDRFLLGSVSQAVALHAKCSVEIVRSPKTKTSESQ